MNDQLPQTSSFILYTAPNGYVKLNVVLQDETIWLNQKHIAELFGKGRSTVTAHLQNIFAEGELYENLACRNFRHAGDEGKTYNTQFYNLDAIISVGYWVNSR